MKKRRIALGLILCLLFTATACGEQKKPESTEKAKDTTFDAQVEDAAEELPEAAAETAEEPAATDIAPAGMAFRCW